RGIAEDPPPNSHFHFTFILSMKSWDESTLDSWTNGKVITYAKLNAGTPKETLSEHLKKFVSVQIQAELEKIRQVDITQFNSQGNRLGFFIQPLLSIHLHSDLSDEIEANGNIQYLYLFGAIAIFITLLACINFMNLSTARSATRAKEVGVRKTVGAQSTRLMGQFLLESYFYIALAVLLALFIVSVALGPFNYFTGKHLSLSVLFEPAFLSVMVVLTLVVGLMAGSYPAFYLTMFSPIDVMKGRIRSRLRSYGIRNVLVVFQFLISAGLIIATLVVYLQLRHVQNINLGFDKRNIINLLHTRNLGENGKAFKEELLKNPAIIAASYSNRLPPNIDWNDVFSTTDPNKDYILAVYEMDYDHLRTMQYKMVTGRFFSPDFPADSTAIILNQAAADKLGFTRMEQQKLRTLYGEREVIGIIQDFNFQSLRDPIQPMAVTLGVQPNWEMAVRIQNNDQEATLEFIRALWKKYSPNAPFEYTFLDENFENKHSTEKRIGMLFLGFTVLAIVIACLGLFGLATFTAEQRIKEIGIRKVLGATEGSIVNLLNRDFLRLVLIANLIAWPITWWLMHVWLGRFAYHITMPWWTFIVAGVATFSIAFLAVSFRAYKAAGGNPVNSLRDE
ncbi:MAG TPA: FtsX-like permease family protein, partial [Ohtaekwangia sp.]